MSKKFTRYQEGTFRRPLERRNSTGTTIADEIKSREKSKEFVPILLDHFEEVGKLSMKSENQSGTIKCDESIAGVAQDR